MKSLARARDRDDLVRRIRNVRPDSRARWGRMSAHQMICHLADGFRMATGEKSASPASGPLQRTLIKWFALYAPLAWPAGIPTRPEMDQAVGGTRPLEFARDVAELETRLVEFAARILVDCAEHPVFGRMTRRDWLRWGYAHTDHHLRQFGC